MCRCIDPDISQTPSSHFLFSFMDTLRWRSRNDRSDVPRKGSQHNRFCCTRRLVLPRNRPIRLMRQTK